MHQNPWQIYCRIELDLPTDALGKCAYLCKVATSDDDLFKIYWSEKDGIANFVLKIDLSDLT